MRRGAGRKTSRGGSRSELSAGRTWNTSVLVKPTYISSEVRAKDAQEAPPAVGLSAASADGVYPAHAGVSARVGRVAVKDAKRGGNSGRGGQWRDSTVETRARRLVTLFCVCGSR